MPVCHAHSILSDPINARAVEVRINFGWLPPRSANYKSPLQSLKKVPHFHAHDAHCTLSFCGSSNDRHSFAGHRTCELRLPFKPRIHVNQFRSQFISATPSPLHPPEKRLNLCDPINRQCAVLPKGWSYLGCYMWATHGTSMIGSTV